MACGSHVSFENEGRLCLFAAEPNPFVTQTPQDFVAGNSVELLVVMESCVSSSCTSDIAATCEASMTGSQITVTSAGSYSEDTGLGGCTDDCRAVSATCSTGPLQPGSYTVVHGEDELVLEVPASVESAPCTSP